MTIQRWVLLLALTLAVTAGGWSVMGTREAARAERAQQEAYVRRRGDGLIRQGISLYQIGDYAAAIVAWERYIAMAPPNADTVSIREMIAEAKGPHIAPPAPKPEKGSGKGKGAKPGKGTRTGAKRTAGREPSSMYLLADLNIRA